MPNLEELYKSIEEKGAALIAADVCLQCLRPEPINGAVFINVKVRIKGQDCDKIAALICKDCCGSLDQHKVLKSISYLASEGHIEVL